MGIKDKLLGDVKERVDRKILVLDNVTKKLLLPGLKQIEKDLKDLGVVGYSLSFSDMSYLGLSFNFDLDGSVVDLQVTFYDPDIEGSNLYFEHYIYLANSGKTLITFPNVPKSIINGNNESELLVNSSNIDDFVVYIDSVVDFISRNGSSIIETIEDAILDILRKSGKL